MRRCASNFLDAIFDSALVLHKAGPFETQIAEVGIGAG